MFLASIVKGLSLLRFWEVWAAIAVYAACNLTWLLLAYFLQGGENSEPNIPGTLFWVFGGTAFQAFLTAIIIFYLIPILLGHTDAMPLTIILDYVPQIFIAAIVAIVAIMVLGFIPIINAILQSLPGLDSFIQCLIVFSLLANTSIEEVIVKYGIQDSVYPGFWQIAGYFVISGILIFSMFMLVSIIGYLIDKSILKTEFLEEASPIIIGPTYNIIGGLLPLFMYAQYIALSLSKVIK